MMNRRNFSKHLLLTAVKSFSWSKMTNSESYLYHSDKKKMIENSLKEYKNFVEKWMEKLKGVMRRTESLMYGVKGYLGASPKLQQSMAILTVPKIQCIFPLSCPCIVDVEVDVRHESSHFLVGDGDEAVGGNNAGQAEHQVSPGP